MRLTELFASSGPPGVRIEGDAELTGIQMDSRSVLPGNAFVCQAGTQRDSHQYLSDAKSSGAVAAIVHSPEGFQMGRQLGLATAQLPSGMLDFNAALWPVLHEFHGHPTRSLRVYGITGTNGKTTVAWLLRDLERAMGLPAAYLGTLGIQAPGIDRELNNTTPFATELVGLLAEVRNSGAQVLAMEISSHALAEYRADGVETDVAVFTNFTQDHLNFHGTMEAYFEAKARLFQDFQAANSKRCRAVLNMDDPMVAQLAGSTTLPVLAFSLRGASAAGVQGRAIQVGLDSIQIAISFDGRTIEVSVPLGGGYNVENTLAAATAFLATGRTLDDLAQALPQVRPVPGRFEPVPNDAGITILVDYAHTPDALEKLLDTVITLAPARVITVFGCGGDRDADKRPKMARVASERSDVTVLTSDNPRTEDPATILAQVRAGIVPGADHVEIIDRHEGITHAMQIARPGDVVVIAGKGHENYQIIGKTKHPMDDRELALAGIKART